MHGIIFQELKKFVVSKAGDEGWKELLEKAGTQRKAFLAVETYPDEELVNIVVTASKALNTPIPDILEAFGEFIVPGLAKTYGALIKPQWKLLDLIENTEAVMHTTVRFKNPGADPPQLKCTRPSPDEVVITYTSKRKLCPLAKGIVKGLADVYKEKVDIKESTCMLKGDSECLISVKKS